MTPLLELRNVEKWFGGLAAVRGVSFAVGEGEVVGLLGPNGSGKTTVLNVASGALRASAGEVALEGGLISGLPPHKVARLGLARTFQLVRVIPSLSVEENVMATAVFGRERHWGEAARRIAREKLALVGLEEKATATVDDLNYIDQKRVELARALASEPRILLLDEWLAGLGPQELQAGVALVRSLRDSGTAIVLVEHIMDAVRALCDRSVVMNVGEIIADGPTETVLNDDKVVDAYLGRANA